MIPFPFLKMGWQGIPYKIYVFPATNETGVLNYDEPMGINKFTFMNDDRLWQISYILLNT